MPDPIILGQPSCLIKTTNCEVQEKQDVNTFYCASASAWQYLYLSSIVSTYLELLEESNLILYLHISMSHRHY